MSKIGIYGAGQYGRAFKRVMDQAGMGPSIFVDDNLAGNEFEGLPVVSVKDVEAETFLYVSVSPMRNTSRLEIKDRLLKLGINQVFDFFESIRAFPKALKEYASYQHLWMRSDISKTLDEKGLGKLRSLLSDVKSEKVLDAIISFRQTLSAESYLDPDNQTEYFPEDVPLFNNEDSIRFVDCGAYIGDTLQSLFDYGDKHHMNISSAISFEPDSNNLEHLLRVQETLGNDRNIPLLTYPCGVWSGNNILSFKEEGSSSSAILFDSTEDALHRVPVVSLDKTIRGLKPNYIKMDIEGAELEALKGGSSIIRKYKPRLAICVYHKPADLWDIPLFISELVPDYKMYLRVHEHMGLSTVLYCVP